MEIVKNHSIHKHPYFTHNISRKCFGPEVRLIGKNCMKQQCSVLIEQLNEHQ
jgi:hypothetical protein